MKFLGRATSLDSFLKAYKASETKGFFPYEWFDSADKLENEELSPYEAFFSKLRKNNPLDKYFKEYQKLRSSQQPHLDGIITNIYKRFFRNLV